MIALQPGDTVKAISRLQKKVKHKNLFSLSGDTFPTG